jgi:hypothetical protein
MHLGHVVHAIYVWGICVRMLAEGYGLLLSVPRPISVDEVASLFLGPQRAYLTF